MRRDKLGLCRLLDNIINRYDLAFRVCWTLIWMKIISSFGLALKESQQPLFSLICIRIDRWVQYNRGWSASSLSRWFRLDLGLISASDVTFYFYITSGYGNVELTFKMYLENIILGLNPQFPAQMRRELIGFNIVRRAYPSSWCTISVLRIVYYFRWQWLPLRWPG